MSRTTQTAPTLLRVTVESLPICELCLNGSGGECHTPGCVLFLSRAPDLPLRSALVTHGAKIESSNTDCTGVSAVWCPVHGDCTCAPGEELNDFCCALHSPQSNHGEAMP